MIKTYVMLGRILLKLTCVMSRYEAICRKEARCSKLGCWVNNSKYRSLACIEILIINRRSVATSSFSATIRLQFAISLCSL